MAAQTTPDQLVTGVDGKSILDRFRLDGRVALITGGGFGYRASLRPRC